jgi:hypothetical protein
MGYAMSFRLPSWSVLTASGCLLLYTLTIVKQVRKSLSIIDNKMWSVRIGIIQDEPVTIYTLRVDNINTHFMFFYDANCTQFATEESELMVFGSFVVPNAENMHTITAILLGHNTGTVTIRKENLERDKGVFSNCITVCTSTGDIILEMVDFEAETREKLWKRMIEAIVSTRVVPGDLSDGN